MDTQLEVAIAEMFKEREQQPEALPESGWFEEANAIIAASQEAAKQPQGE